jgi:hypothetical protein
VCYLSPNQLSDTMKATADRRAEIHPSAAAMLVSISNEQESAANVEETVRRLRHRR